ncbi:MAG: alpha/beta hydrolase [Gammaproteobacteria bacterium]|nr:alpha/beta hydrolase [Gammaproteobacteria bacterium]
MFRNFLYAVFAILIIGLGGVLLVGGSLADPQVGLVGVPPKGFQFESLEIERADGKKVAGWFVAGEIGKPGVLLLHSVRSNRKEMIGRAKFLVEAGYSALLIDMQAHGETPGENITFGFRESFDVRAAVNYLQRRVEPQKVGVIGVSLGGAAALLGESPVQADAVILEAVYSSIERAVENRISIRLGNVSKYLAPLLTWQIEPRLGISLEELSPLRAIGNLKAPVMIVAGIDDRHTKSEESRQLFEEACEPKQLWLIDGAKHENLHSYAGKEYEKRVLLFFRKHLEGANA